jgi:hypothetical protein
MNVEIGRGSVDQVIFNMKFGVGVFRSVGDVIPGR